MVFTPGQEPAFELYLDLCVSAYIWRRGDGVSCTCSTVYEPLDARNKKEWLCSDFSGEVRLMNHHGHKLWSSPWPMECVDSQICSLLKSHTILQKRERSQRQVSPCKPNPLTFKTDWFPSFLIFLCSSAHLDLLRNLVVSNSSEKFLLLQESNHLKNLQCLNTMLLPRVSWFCTSHY